MRVQSWLAPRLCRGGLAEPFGGKGGKRRVQLDAREVPTESEGGQPGGAGAAEHVEHYAAWFAARLDAPGRDVDRERGEVRPEIWAGRDGPHVAGIAALGMGRAAAAVAVALGADYLRRVWPVLRRARIARARPYAGFPGGRLTPELARVVACGMRIGSRSNQ